MSLLFDYEQRTEWKYKPIRGLFHTNEGLSCKVDCNGNYVPFYGSTVVFRPSQSCLQVIQLMQRILYHRLEGTDMLSDPLPVSTVHMTLHDLVSPEMCVSEPLDKGKYDQEVSDSLTKAMAIVEGIRYDYAGRKITMVSDRIVNMVSKSLVLMLRPKTEQDYELLLELYHRFDCVKSLPYSLTPHVTLAYFRPGMIDGDKLGAAVAFAQINPENAPEFDFYVEALTAQSFSDMRSYLDVPERICFCCDGGLNRSVMAAGILKHLAKERGLPVTGEARSAFPNTRGQMVSEQVWSTLKRHGIEKSSSCLTARYLEDYESSWFTHFAAISEGAAHRMSWLGLPDERVVHTSKLFYGIRDPEYGEVTYEQVFEELHGKIVRYMGTFEQ